jgi:hypothetical protein
MSRTTRSVMAVHARSANEHIAFDTDAARGLALANFPVPSFREPLASGYDSTARRSPRSRASRAASTGEPPCPSRTVTDESPIANCNGRIADREA